MVRDSSLHRENRHHWDRICCEKLDNFFKFFFSNFFFSSYFLSFVFWVFFESDGKIEINNKKNWAGNFFFEKFETFFYLGKVFFFLVTTFKFGLFSSFFIGSAAKTTNSILNFFFNLSFLRDCWSCFFRSRGCFREQKMWCYFS